LTSVRRIRKRALAVVASAALGVSLFAGLAPNAGNASSHREAPLISGDPQVDTTDLYAFVSPDRPDTVTLISNWIPFEEPAGGPNFYKFQAGASYDFNIDNDGDAVADMVFRFTFKDHYRNPNTFLYNTGPVTGLNDGDLNFYQTYDVRMLAGGATTQLVHNKVVVPSRVGAASMPDYGKLVERGTNSILNGDGLAFAGQADDTFFLDLRVFNLLYGGSFQDVGEDTLHGFNVNTLGLQLPKSLLAKDGDASSNPIIGIWATAERPSVRTQTGQGTVQLSGAPVQVSRLGMPLVNEVVIPVGVKDLWNASEPSADGQFLSYVNDPEVPHLVNAFYGIPVPDSDPNTPGIQRSDLIAVFLTGVDGLNQPPNVTPSEELRLNMSVAPCQPGSCANYSRLGVIGGDVAGYPNGRRLADDVIDISLQVVEGVLLGQDTGLSDGVDTNDHPFLATFPYQALPFSGSSGSPHIAVHG
jgi:hypothetical protein